MAISQFSIFLAVLLVQSSIAQQLQQRTIIYDGLASGGSYLIIPQTYVPTLAAHGFDNRAQSTCVTGVWLFYDYENYNAGINAGMEYIYGRDNYCVNFLSLGRRVTSIRYAGSPTDYTEDTLTLYEGTYFQGEEEYTPTDLPNLNLIDNHRSIIITGRNPWTLYDRPNYEGIAICIEPPQSGTPFAPAFIYDIENLDVPHGAIRSVRKGCFGKRPQISNDGETTNISGFARGGQNPDPDSQPE